MARRMTAWETDIGLGVGVGVALMAVIILVDAGAVVVAIYSRIINAGTFAIGLGVLFSLGLLGLMGYWLYGLFGSRYLLDRNELIIQWGLMEQVIPMEQVRLVLTGDEVTGRIRFVGGQWPGHCVGHGEVPDVGPTLFYATVPPAYQLYVVTPTVAYGISPVDRDGFLESIRQRMKMGPTQTVVQSSKRPGFLDWAIWRDRLGLGLLGGGVVAVMALVGLLCLLFPSLPPVVPLHFDALGNPDRLGSRAQLFITPLIGLLTLLINGMLGGLAYRRERMVSYLLWGGSLLVQIWVWVATLGLVGRI